MGVDIGAFKIKKLEPGEINFPIEPDENHETWVHDDFHRTLLPHEKVDIIFNAETYEYENKVSLGEELSMGYGSYNFFRNKLAIAALGKSCEQIWDEVCNLEDQEDYPHPLYHLINFSDCEGEIGPKAVELIFTYLEGEKERITDAIGKDLAPRFERLFDMFKRAYQNKPHGFVSFG